MGRMMDDGKTEDLSGFRSAYPLRFKRATVLTYWSGRMAEPVTSKAALKPQLLLLAKLPKRFIVISWLRSGNFIR